MEENSEKRKESKNQVASRKDENMEIKKKKKKTRRGGKLVRTLRNMKKHQENLMKLQMQQSMMPWSNPTMMSWNTKLWSNRQKEESEDEISEEGKKKIKKVIMVDDVEEGEIVDEIATVHSQEECTKAKTEEKGNDMKLLEKRNKILQANLEQAKENLEKSNEANKELFLSRENLVRKNSILVKENEQYKLEIQKLTSCIIQLEEDNKKLKIATLEHREKRESQT